MFKSFQIAAIWVFRSVKSLDCGHQKKRNFYHIIAVDSKVASELRVMLYRNISFYS